MNTLPVYSSLLIYIIREVRVCQSLWSVFIVTPPRTHKISGLKSQVLKPTFLLKTDDEKWSRIFYLEILLAPSELLLPSAKKSAEKG